MPADGSVLQVDLVGHGADPGFDTALSRAVLLRVDRGELPATLRLFRPGRIVAFGSRDVASPGYADARAAATAHGFAAVQRLAGGRAAVFTPDTVALALAVPSDRPAAAIQERFDDVAGRIRDALAEIGVDARVGEVTGEYCPGTHSVNARGAVKLAGIGQRLLRGAAHTGGVIVVDGADTIRSVLLDVYAALGIDWDPATVGSVAEERPGTSWDTVRDTLLAAFARDHDLIPWTPDPATLALARGVSHATW